ncbi:MAG: hypothetical protein DWG76_01365 [Chloroflexi bacterium]|nr:hypothetical protein [Chloroflexota bacterium]
MNPVTQALLKQIDDAPLHTFVADWDALEALLIEVYKAGGAEADQIAEYVYLREQLAARYPQFADELSPRWQATSIKGRPLTQDPFLALIEPLSAQEFVGNWSALQTLPAAREALNEMLVARLERAQP